MALALPIDVSEPAWRAIRDEVIAPARGGATAGTAADAAGMARLADAWSEAGPQAGRRVVWLDPELAAILAGLLDARPELATHLGAVRV